MGNHEWFRWLVVGVPAVVAGGIAGAFMSAWLAGAVGVGIGLAAAFALAKWEDRYFPDLVEVYEQAKK